jgi:hypothetical protein
MVKTSADSPFSCASNLDEHRAQQHARRLLVLADAEHDLAEAYLASEAQRSSSNPAFQHLESLKTLKSRFLNIINETCPSMWLMNLRQIDGWIRGRLVPASSRVESSSTSGPFSPKLWFDVLRVSLKILTEEQHRRASLDGLSQPFNFLHQLAHLFLQASPVQPPDSPPTLDLHRIGLSLLLTPFLVDLLCPVDPDEWQALPTMRWNCSYLRSSCRFVCKAVLPCINEMRSVGMPDDEIAGFVGRELRATRDRFLAVEAEKKAHDAILDAVLAWKRRVNEPQKKRA